MMGGRGEDDTKGRARLLPTYNIYIYCIYIYIDLSNKHMSDFLINSRACQRIHANWGESVGFATCPGLKSIICPVNIV